MWLRIRCSLGVLINGTYKHFITSLTLLALQSHSGLQVVHLHLQALQSQVVLVGLASVGQEDDDDDDEEQASSSCDAEDGRKREQAVGADVNFSGRDVESSDLDLED